MRKEGSPFHFLPPVLIRLKESFTQSALICHTHTYTHKADFSIKGTAPISMLSQKEYCCSAVTHLCFCNFFAYKKQWKFLWQRKFSDNGKLWTNGTHKSFCWLVQQNLSPQFQGSTKNVVGSVSERSPFYIYPRMVLTSKANENWHWASGIESP